MKVCTDSCVFGALINTDHANTILDIGTGTGLLALMMAQRTSDETIIDAIERDVDAMRDAEDNFASSDWHHRIRLIHADIREWKSQYRYDVIVCNPPFHHNSTLSASPKEISAFHADETLPFTSLAEIIALSSDEYTESWILLPIHEMNLFVDIAHKHLLHVRESILVHDIPEAPPIRRICKFTKGQESKVFHSVFSYKSHRNGPFSTAFIKAMSPYYLFL